MMSLFLIIFTVFFWFSGYCTGSFAAGGIAKNGGIALGGVARNGGIAFGGYADGESSFATGGIADRGIATGGIAYRGIATDGIVYDGSWDDSDEFPYEVLIRKYQKNRRGSGNDWNGNLSAKTRRSGKRNRNSKRQRGSKGYRDSEVFSPYNRKSKNKRYRKQY